MSGSGNFSLGTAGALVAGGIAASILATAVALGGASCRSRGPASGNASGAASPSPRSSGVASTQSEYLLDVSEVAAEPTGP